MSKRENIYAYEGWYPSDEITLRKTIEGYPKSTDKKAALGVISPHAGYYFSGKCANKVFSSVEIPKSVLVLSVSHRGHFDYLPLFPAGSWNTPLGDIEIDEKLNAELLQLDFVREDESAHDSEHSGEMQLPFLKYYRNDVKMSIINVGLSPLYHADSTDFETIKRFGEKLGNVLKEYDEKVLIVASSDMSHEDSDKETRRLDKLVLDILPEYNPKKLYDVLSKNRISMCGGIPALIMLVAGKILGGRNAQIVEYYTSSDITGEKFGRSVGYCGLRVTK